jgi:hypothetical protein
MTFITLLSGLLTPTIGIVTATILVLQHRIERQKWRLALFDKRYPVFLSAMGFIAAILTHGRPRPEDLNEFLRDSKDRDLLFGDAVKENLELLYKKGVELRTHQSLIDPLPVGDERTKHAKAIDELLNWFGDQYQCTRKAFYPYIKIDEI